MRADVQRHALANLPRGRDPVPIVHETEWAPGPFWTGAENFCPTDIRSPDCQYRSYSLYRATPAEHYNDIYIALTLHTLYKHGCEIIMILCVFISNCIITIRFIGVRTLMAA